METQIIYSDEREVVWYGRRETISDEIEVYDSVVR
jgi:hypothetical protein